MTINFGPVVSTLDYNNDRKPDQVFEITGGGIGTIGIASAIQTGNKIKFNFTSAICSGGASGRGDGSFFWGLVSRNPSKLADATLHEASGAIHYVKVRVPQ
jgi:hypothetical protein